MGCGTSTLDDNDYQKIENNTANKKKTQDLESSSILSANEIQQFLTQLSTHKKPLIDMEWNLLYKANSDELNKDTFMENVHDKVNIICFIETDGNNICGGYTSIGWPTDHLMVSNGSYSSSYQPFLKDSKAFVFSLRSSKNYEPMIVNVQSAVNALAYPDDRDWYCQFGRGYQDEEHKTRYDQPEEIPLLRINKDGELLTGKQSYQSSYESFPNEYQLLGGNIKEKVVNIEVFQLKKVMPNMDDSKRDIGYISSNILSYDERDIFCSLLLKTGKLKGLQNWRKIYGATDYDLQLPKDMFKSGEKSIKIRDDFIDKVYGKPNVIVIIREEHCGKKNYENNFAEKRYENVFGGYTSTGWNKDFNGYCSRDDKAFLFSIRSSANYEPQIFDVRPSMVEQALGYSKEAFCGFGYENDDRALCIDHHLRPISVRHATNRLKGASYGPFPNRYHLLGGMGDEGAIGGYHGEVKEIEVFELT